MTMPLTRARLEEIRSRFASDDSEGGEAVRDLLGEVDRLHSHSTSLFAIGESLTGIELPPFPDHAENPFD